MTPSRTDRRQTDIAFHAVMAAVCIAYFLFHMHFMQRFLDWDQVVYVNNMMDALRTNSVPLMFPHHMHFETTGALFHLIMVKLFGNAGFTEIMFNNRLRSLVAACAGVYFTALALRDLTGRPGWGVLGGLLVGFCQGYVAYATKVDTSIFPTAAFPAMLWLLLSIDRARRGLVARAFAAGMLMFAAVMFHQYMAFSCVFFVIAMLPPRWFFTFRGSAPLFVSPQGPPPLIDRAAPRYTAAAVAALSGMALIAAVYFYAGAVLYKKPYDPTPPMNTKMTEEKTFQKWMFAYATVDVWGNGLRYFYPENSFFGYSRAFLAQSRPSARYDIIFEYDFSRFTPASFVHNQTAVFTAVGLLGSLLFAGGMWRRYGRCFVFLVTSFVAFSVFFTYFEARYFEFWLIPCMIACILAVMVLNLLCEKVSPLAKSLPRWLCYAYLLFMAVIVAAHNTVHFTVPNARVRRVDVSPDWDREYWTRLLGDSVYRNPANPHAEVCGTAPGQVFFTEEECRAAGKK